MNRPENNYKGNALLCTNTIRKGKECQNEILNFRENNARLTGALPIYRNKHDEMIKKYDSRMIEDAEKFALCDDCKKGDWTIDNSGLHGKLISMKHYEPTCECKQWTYHDNYYQWRIK